MTNSELEWAHVETGGVSLTADPSLVEDARALGLLTRGGLAHALARASGSTGRAPTARLDLPHRKHTLVLRPVRHGGMFAPLRGGALCGLARPLAELRTTADLRTRGAPVPRPAFVLGERRWGPFWNAAVATFLEPQTCDALTFLATQPERKRLLRAAAAAGRAVRCFHDAGGQHRDLHIKNLLVRENEQACEVIVIDLDGARLRENVTPPRRTAELARLYRSLLKRGVVEQVGPRGLAVFLTAYTHRERDLRRALCARWRRERLKVHLHALHYRGN